MNITPHDRQAEIEEEIELDAFTSALRRFRRKNCGTAPDPDLGDYAALSPQVLSLLICSQAEEAIKRGEPEAARKLILDAAALDSTLPKIWKVLRSLNAPVNALSKLYHVEIEGEMSVPNFKIRPQFYGSYDVIANDRTEALAFIKEVEPIADKNSLKIQHAVKKRNIRGDEHRGVVFRYPSISSMG